MIISVYDRVENIMEKRGNIGYQDFLLLPQYFQNAYTGLFKVVIMWWRVNSLPHNPKF